MRRGALSLAALSALALAAGCSTGGSASGAAGTITIGALPGVDTVPLFSAEHSGQFSAGGVSVQIKKYVSVAAEVSALKNGQIDMAAGDYGPFLYAQSQQKASGPQIKVVADGYDATQGVLEVLAKPGSGITSPQDLAGKTIAAPSEAVLPKSASAQASAANGSGAADSLDTAAATSVLRSYGISIGTVSWKVMSQSAEIAALRDGSVQAILVNEPYLYQAQSQLGAIEVLDACSGATAGLPLSGYFAMSSWTGGHAAAVRRLQVGPGQVPGHRGHGRPGAEQPARLHRHDQARGEPGHRRVLPADDQLQRGPAGVGADVRPGPAAQPGRRRQPDHPLTASKDHQ